MVAGLIGAGMSILEPSTVFRFRYSIAANVVSPANDFANVFPRHIDVKRGARPALRGYSESLGAIAGVLIVACRARCTGR